MAIKLGLMGFGRIGRNIFRILYKRSDVEVAVISDIADHKALEYLLRFDTVLGRFPEKVRVKDGLLNVGGLSIPMLSGRNPGDVDWKRFGVDVVVEATARPRARAELVKHLEAGARRVVLCVPSIDPPDIICVMGVNDGQLSFEHRIISNASCTANCLGPVAKVLQRSFGIRQGFATAIHAYTNDQRLADVPADDLRRSRAAAENIIPTDTRAHEIVVKLIPELEGRLQGMAMNVPVPDGSVVDLTVQLSKPATKAEVNEAFRVAAAGELRDIVEYVDDPIVSSDVIGNSHSAIFDSLATLAIGEDLVKVIAWFDNGWGYATRVVDLVNHLATLQEAEARS